MKSLSYAGGGRVELVDVPDPQPGPGELLIRIEASAVCGSERTAIIHGMIGNSGHEAFGTVLNPGSSQYSAGERVGLAAVVGCGSCQRCVAGQELHCERGYRSSSRSGGWHSELATVPGSALRRVPSGTDPAVAVLLTGDGLGVPARGLRRVPSLCGETVLIIGLGPVGLGHALVRAFAGSRVVGVEPSPYRRELAKKLGAIEVLAPGEELTDRPRIVIEATGRVDCILRALELVDNGGIVLQSGECHDPVPISPSEVIIRREVTYTGAWYYSTEDYPDMLGLLDGGLRLGDLCTHDVDIADAQSAISDFLAGESGKVVLRWNAT